MVTGVAFKKTFSYAGFEMQPKSYENPKIALLNVELELKAEKDNAEVRVKSVEVRRGILLTIGLKMWLNPASPQRGGFLFFTGLPSHR